MADVTVGAYLNDMLSRMVSPEAKEELLIEWYKSMYEYIPFVTGNLANNISIQSDGIHFKVPYARRQYYGDNFNFTKDQHPLAQARWGNVAWDLHQEEIMNDFINYLKKGET